MDWQTLIVLLVGLLAGVYLAGQLRRLAAGGKTGCGGCNARGCNPAEGKSLVALSPPRRTG
jgi:hypothetical protein